MNRSKQQPQGTIINPSSQMENSAHLALAEYQSLRQEILDILNREVSLANLGFPVIAAILGYFGKEVGDGSRLMLLSPLIILWLMLTHWQNSTYGILGIAAYLRSCVEECDKSLYWESVNYLIRANKGPFRKQRIFNAFNYGMIAIITGFICILSATKSIEFIRTQSLQNEIVTIISTILWIYKSATFLRRLRIAALCKYEAELSLEWEAYKNVIKSKKCD